MFANYLFIKFLIIFTAFPVFSQESEFIRVKSGEDPKMVIPIQRKYRFIQFMPGIITYQNGTAARANMNYSTLLGEIQFIDPNKDTLALANEVFIKKVVIGESVFFYDGKSGFVEVVREFPKTMLAENQVLVVVGSEKETAYGQSTSVSSIRNVSSLATTNGQVSQLKRKGDLIFSKRNTFYIIDQNNRIHRANKKNVLKVNNHYKVQVEQYIREKAPDFNNREDLETLLEFCSGLN